MDPKSDSSRFSLLSFSSTDSLTSLKDSGLYSISLIATFGVNGVVLTFGDNCVVYFL